MHKVFLVGDQPMPGYKLLEMVESSAFYRMWKTLCPDGRVRLWKEIDLILGNAAIETRTLSMLVQLQHRNINSLTNFWQLDNGDTLVIESEVPLSSLRHRYNECQKATGKGIPRDELIGYFTDAAAGLDFLNQPTHVVNGQKVAIYHRALQPNVLLLYREATGVVCKISEFGLAKPVSDQVAMHSQGLLHYEYDPPEFFEGQTTPTSDQFSLAVNYVELRTGKFPFQGTMLEQLQSRLSDHPQLADLPDAERQVIKKALSREPSQRFESSSAFVKALRQATGAVAPTLRMQGSTQALPSAELTPSVIPVENEPRLREPVPTTPLFDMEKTPVLSPRIIEATLDPKPQDVFTKPATSAATMETAVVRRPMPESFAKTEVVDPASLTRAGGSPATKDLKAFRKQLAGTSQFKLPAITAAAEKEPDAEPKQTTVPLRWVGVILIVLAVAALTASRLL